MLKYGTTTLLVWRSIDEDLDQFVPRYTDAITVPYYSNNPHASIPRTEGDGPIVHPVYVDLDLSTASGTVWGVRYEDGKSMQRWTPRLDHLPDYDRRHQPANRAGRSDDAAEIVAMAQIIMARDVALPGSKIYGAAILSTVDDGTSICADAGPLTVGDRVIFGAEADADCWIEIKVSDDDAFRQHTTFMTLFLKIRLTQALLVKAPRGSQATISVVELLHDPAWTLEVFDGTRQVVEQDGEPQTPDCEYEVGDGTGGTEEGLGDASSAGACVNSPGSPGAFKQT
jgi:hypothetical protein